MNYNEEYIQVDTQYKLIVKRLSQYNEHIYIFNGRNNNMNHLFEVFNYHIEHKKKNFSINRILP